MPFALPTIDLNTPVRVEFHTWTDGTPQMPNGFVDVTRYVTSLSWTDSLLAPWSDIQIQMAVPFRYIRDIIPGRKVPHGLTMGSNTNELPQSEESPDVRYGYVPEPGFWVVIRNHSMPRDEMTASPSPQESGRALAFGRAHMVNFGVAVRQNNSSTVTLPVSIKAESFLAFTGRSSMQFAPQGGGAWGMDGFVWDIQTWGDDLTSLAQSLITGRPGDLLARMWPSLVKLQVPPTLAGGQSPELGSLVPVVQDDPAAHKWIPARTLEVHPVMGGMMIPNAGALLPNHPSLLSFFLTTFYANHEAVEFFCTMDYPTGEGSDLTGLGESLGGVQPVIIYRLKPWFIKHVNKATVRSTSEAKDKEAAAAALTMDKVIGAYATRTDDGLWYEWPTNEVVNAQMGWSDAKRVNLVSGNWIASLEDTPSNYGLLGTPIIPDTETVKRHGLRAYSLRWPFMQKGMQMSTDSKGRDEMEISADTDPQQTSADGPQGVDGVNMSATAQKAQPSLTEYQNAMIELGWMMTGDGQRWCNGSWSGLYKPWIKPGHWARVHFFDATLSCYIESVTHSITTEQGTGLLRKETSVSFSRGTLAHQDTPSYQFRLETRGSNPPGKPVQLVTSTGAEGKGEAEGGNSRREKAMAAASAKPLPGGEAILYTASQPLMRKSKTQVATKKICIVVHYTAISTIEGMLKEFGRPQTYTDEKAKKTYTYYKSTHYSVEKNGRIIQWLNPEKDSANHVAAGEGSDSSTIGIDVVISGRELKTTGLPEGQARALALLIDHLVSQYQIPKTVSPPNTYFEVKTPASWVFPVAAASTIKTTKVPSLDLLNTKGVSISVQRDMDSKVGEPTYDSKKNFIGYTYTLKTAADYKWGICRHRDFDHTPCPFLISLEDIMAMDRKGHTLSIAQLTPEGEAELLAISKANGAI